MAIVGEGARASYNDYTAERWLSFELWIVDLPSSKVVWLANAAVKMTGQGMSGKGAGVTFAKNLVARLQSDGVLSGCPPQETRPAPRADEARISEGTRHAPGDRRPSLRMRNEPKRAEGALAEDARHARHARGESQTQPPYGVRVQANPSEPKTRKTSDTHQGIADHPSVCDPKQADEARQARQTREMRDTCDGIYDTYSI
jgi:hypothetical protein